MKYAEILCDGRPCTKAGLATSYFLRLRGLIGRDVAAMGGLWIHPCAQIHTCFMSCPIDVVYLTKELEVIKVDPAVPKGKFCAMVRHARSVLELPAGKAEEYGIRTGCRLEVKR